MLPFTPTELEAAVADGHVTKRPHPTLPLFIYNYSPSVQFEKRWNNVTLNCRGLILDDEYNIVARPWKKFFNLGEVELPMQLTDPVEIMDKADGSLGILYPTDDGYAISTRGSFASEQAIKATQIWNDKYGDMVPLRGYTLLFEIIYPSNRIVLDYDDMEDLILLGAVDTKNGWYISPRDARWCWEPKDDLPTFGQWPGPVVETFTYNNVSEALGYMERKNAEGYVIRSHNFMVKLKQPDYLDLHRLVTNASPRTVWEQLKAGKSKSEIISAFPDEFHDYIRGFADPLTDKFDKRIDEIFKGYANVMDSFMSDGREFDRGDFARFIKKAPDKGYYFNMLDNRSIKEVLWAELKPTTEE